MPRPRRIPSRTGKRTSTVEVTGRSRWRKPLGLPLLFAMMSARADAACLLQPLENEVASATTVFIATITSAKMDVPVSQLKDGDGFKVLYDFVVARPIKGDPATVGQLSSGAGYDDPNDGSTYHLAETSRFLPGDNVLVVADAPGIAPISRIGCAPSRPWDGETQQLVRKFPIFRE